LLSKEEFVRLTDQVIGQAFARGIPDNHRELGRELKRLVDDAIPAATPDWPQNRELLLKRVMNAVARDDSGRLLSVVREMCRCGPGDEKCAAVCAMAAIRHLPTGTAIDPGRCVACGLCAETCDSGAIVEKSECLRLVSWMSERGIKPLYAIVAPSWVGQFGESVSDAQLQEGLKRLGFSDVFEVALAADIITLREAEEYIDRHDRGEPFMITSCCCPAFVRLIHKRRANIVHLVSDSVSPMIAMGRLLKAREPNCRVVFIGPCLAKKAESKLEELKDAVDSVLTFKETRALFEAVGVALAELPAEEPMMDASHDGRIYAHTGGVSAAITNAIERSRPDIHIRTVKGNGLKECMGILDGVESGEETANFMEGMGCPGGCIGGPGTCVKVEVAEPLVNGHADDALTRTATNNDLAVLWLEEYGGQTNFHTWYDDKPSSVPTPAAERRPD
jgi:iron only hydrogenase large subunit-like protein